jgi:uncharacterized membrane protein YuzA (DUF378 family)
MDYQNMLNLLVQILLIAGAINWGLVAYNNTDIVKMAIGGDIEKYIKYIIAVAGIYHAYTLVM